MPASKGKRPEARFLFSALVAAKQDLEPLVVAAHFRLIWVA
jgi:hypothetical protein